MSAGTDANAAIGIVPRRGLNKLRHVELDVLWIQEQQARRLLPLRKVPGPRNPSDMMTKNVDQAHIDMYLDLLNLRFDIGRADIAQNLHSMGEHRAAHFHIGAPLRGFHATAALWKDSQRSKAYHM